MLVFGHLIYLGTILWLYLSNRDLRTRFSGVTSLPPVIEIIEKFTISPSPPLRAPEIPPDFCVNVNDAPSIIQECFAPLANTTTETIGILDDLLDDLLDDAVEPIVVVEHNSIVAAFLLMIVMVFLWLVLYDLQMPVQKREGFYDLKDRLKRMQNYVTNLKTENDRLQATVLDATVTPVTPVAHASPTIREQELAAQLAAMTAMMDQYRDTIRTHMADPTQVAGGSSMMDDSEGWTDNMRKNIDDLKAAMETLEDDNTSLSAEKERLQAVNNRLGIERTDLENVSKRLDDEKRQLEAKNGLLEQDNSKLNLKVDQLKDENTDHKERIEVLEQGKMDVDNERRTLEVQIEELKHQVHVDVQHSDQLEKVERALKDEVQRLKDQLSTQTTNSQYQIDAATQTVDGSLVEHRRSSEQAFVPNTLFSPASEEIHPDQLFTRDPDADIDFQSNPPTPRVPRVRLQGSATPSHFSREDPFADGVATTQPTVDTDGADDIVAGQDDGENKEKDAQRPDDDEPAPRDNHSDSDGDNGNDQPPPRAGGAPSRASIQRYVDLVKPHFQTNDETLAQIPSFVDPRSGSGTSTPVTQILIDPRSGSGTSTPVTQILIDPRSGSGTSTPVTQILIERSPSAPTVSEAPSTVSEPSVPVQPTRSDISQINTRLANVSIDDTQSQGPSAPNTGDLSSQPEAKVAQVPMDLPVYDDYQFNIPRFVTNIQEVPAAFEVSRRNASRIWQYNRYLLRNYNHQRQHHERSNLLTQTALYWGELPGQSETYRYMMITVHHPPPFHSENGSFEDYLRANGCYSSADTPTEPRAMRNNTNSRIPIGPRSSNYQPRAYVPPRAASTSSPSNRNSSVPSAPRPSTSQNSQATPQFTLGQRPQTQFGQPAQIPVTNPFSNRRQQSPPNESQTSSFSPPPVSQGINFGPNPFSPPPTGLQSPAPLRPTSFTFTSNQQLPLMVSQSPMISPRSIPDTTNQQFIFQQPPPATQSSSGSGESRRRSELWESKWAR